MLKKVIRCFCQKKNKSKIQWFNCKRFRHKFESKNKKGDRCNQYAKVVRTFDNGDKVNNIMLLACDVVVEDQQNIFGLDSGCNIHICGSKELFKQ